LTADSALAVALRRDRLLALASLLLIAALAWLWLLDEASRMAAMDTVAMANMRMNHMQMLSPSFTAWSAQLAGYLFLMWFVMMIGMMLPSAAPLLLLYMGVARHAAGSGHRFASAAWFLAGYLCAWALFSVAAMLAQWALESAAMMTPAMSTASRPMGAAVLIAAGIYQWLPVKDACLSRCHAPLPYIQQHGGFQPEAGSGWLLGLRHGLYCVGCCWALMLLLFVFGVMNLLWVAALMIYVLAEKLLPGARLLARTVGTAAVVAGIVMLSTLRG
jgi:predicted metal-binding membrane protein